MKLAILNLMFRYILLFIYFLKGHTDFGIYIDKEKMQEKFNSDAKQSKIFVDYNIFDTEQDKYKTDYINSNCLRLPVVYISKFL